VAWPVAHIANIKWLAVAVNIALVAGFAAVAAHQARTARATLRDSMAT
jgi:hypothetical protein